MIQVAGDYAMPKSGGGTNDRVDEAVGFGEQRCGGSLEVSLASSTAAVGGEGIVNRMV